MAGGTPWNVPAANRIGLRAEESSSDGTGLFFTELEFSDYVSRRRLLKYHKFHDEFLEWVFHLTAGHIGALESMIRCVQADDVSVFFSLATSQSNV